MRLYCDHYGHWKNILVCALSCRRTDRCRQFALSLERRPSSIRELVYEYVRAHPYHDYSVKLVPVRRGRKKREEVTVKKFVCISQDKAEILTEDEVAARALEGEVYDQMYEVGREMELQIRLVPKKSKAAEAPTPKKSGASEPAKSTRKKKG